MTDPLTEDPGPESRSCLTSGRSDLTSELSAGGLPLDPDVDPVNAVRPLAEGGPFDRPRPADRLRLGPAVLVTVFAGGCAGGLARYQVTKVWPTSPHGFPWATLVINDTGALLLALLLVLVSDVLPPTTYVRPLLGTGFCGAYTTFSSVVVTTDQLLAHGHPALGSGYLLASLVTGLGSAALGLALGRALGTWRDRGAGTGQLR